MEHAAQKDGAMLDMFGDIQAETSTIFVKL
jgi:hypothetical protein